jgi:spore coat polysaccharide biosynthesis protein SpsF (cytidylyltransferase family)
MLETLGIVQACLPHRRTEFCMRRRFGGRPLLEWVIRRVTDSAKLDGVVVLVCDEHAHQLVKEQVPLDVPVAVGNGADPLARFTKVLEQYPAQSVVRVRADSPFVDPGLIDRLVASAAKHSGVDYASYCSRDGRPAILSPLGVFAEWIRGTALRKADRAARVAADRRDVTRYIYSHPEKFNLRLLPAPEKIDREDVRLTLDRDEDWENALAIYDALGPEGLEWQRIAELLDHQPALRHRMAALNRAGAMA